jgi:SnoaL-like domain
MPWLPELFTAPALQRLLDERRRESLVAVPYFDGLMAGDPDPLVESFVGEPEVHDPVRGRVKGEAAFRAFVAEASAWLREHHASVDDVEHVILDRHGFEEVVLHLDSNDAAVDLPIAVVADRQLDGRIDEVRVYFGGKPLTGRHANRPPLLQPDPGLLGSDVVAEYLRAFTAGDVGAIVTAFEPDGCASGLGGDEGIHRGPDRLRAFYGRLFSHGGGIPLEPCALVDDGRGCALEYNVVGWGTTRLPPQAGVAVFVRGASRRLASVRVYDDVVPPLVPVP